MDYSIRSINTPDTFKQLIVIANLYQKHYQTIEIYTGYIDSLDILIHFSFTSRIVITRVYCIGMINRVLLHQSLQHQICIPPITKQYKFIPGYIDSLDILIHFPVASSTE